MDEWSNSGIKIYSRATAARATAIPGYSPGELPKHVFNAELDLVFEAAERENSPGALLVKPRRRIVVKSKELHNF